MIEIFAFERKHQNVIDRLESSPSGISLLPNGSIPDLKDGFIVSVTNNTPERVTPSLIDTVLSQIKKNNVASMVGGWFSEKTNLFFVDASAFVRELGQALELAQTYNQEAIYDVANNSCIYLQ